MPFPSTTSIPTVQQWSLTFEQNMGHSIGLRLSYSGSHGAEPRSHGRPEPGASEHRGLQRSPPPCLPYPNWSVIQSVENAAFSNYQSGTVELSRHSEKSTELRLSYIFTRDLSNAGGVTPNAFAVAGGSFLTDRFNPRLDYGNVIYDRRQRFLVTYLYNLPFGARPALADQKRCGMVWRATGNWREYVFQSGPFLTPYEQSMDPANTNILTTVGLARPDQLQPLALRGHSAPRPSGSIPWRFLTRISRSITSAGNLTGIGRFGNAPVGGVAGPGTANFSHLADEGRHVQ